MGTWLANLRKSHEARLEAQVVEAVENRQIEILKRLLARGVRSNGRDRVGMTALHIASGHGGVEAVKLLLAHGADVNARNNGGYTPLHLAIMWEHTTVAELLLAAGADVNARRGDGATPLHLTVDVEIATTHTGKREDEAGVRVLLAHGADVNARYRDGATALHKAASLGYAATAGLLLAHGAEVDARDEHGATPLHEALASTHGDEGMVRAFLEHGADVNARTKRGETPLHIASACGHVVLVELLLARAADVNARNVRGATPLHYAGNEGIVRALLAHGADAKLEDKVRETSLHEAASRHDVAAVNLLLRQGALVDARSVLAQTPLHFALRSGSETAVPPRHPYWGPSRSQIQAQEQFWGVIETLLRHGADVNARDRDDQTPLHYAAARLCPKAVALLLAGGADVDARDGRGRTAYDLAGTGQDDDTEKVDHIDDAIAYPAAARIDLRRAVWAELSRFDVSRPS